MIGSIDMDINVILESKYKKLSEQNIWNLLDYDVKTTTLYPFIKEMSSFDADRIKGLYVADNRLPQIPLDQTELNYYFTDSIKLVNPVPNTYILHKGGYVKI